MSSGAPSGSDRPAVDARLVAPESRYEIEDGRVCYVAPSDEPHGSRHSKVSALLEAHVADAYDVASDMLTRSSEMDDFAPDASVFPAERDEAGGRQLEELAFEVVSTESLGHAARKAAKLVERGVRRVFAIDVERRRALEWSRETDGWGMLDSGHAIEDRALAAPLPVDALVHAAKADDAMASALLAKGNRVIEAALAQAQREAKAEGRAEALAEAVLAVLAARGLELRPDERQRIATERELSVLGRWLERAATSASVREILSGE